MDSDKFFKIGFFVILGLNLVSGIFALATKTYSSIPAHEKEITKAIRQDYVTYCDLCDEEYFEFELYDDGDHTVCHDCLKDNYGDILAELMWED